MCLARCSRSRSADFLSIVFGPQNACGVLPVSPCEERAGREPERGEIDKKHLLSPALSSFLRWRGSENAVPRSKQIFCRTQLIFNLLYRAVSRCIAEFYSAGRGRSDTSGFPTAPQRTCLKAMASTPDSTSRLQPGASPRRAGDRGDRVVPRQSSFRSSGRANPSCPGPALRCSPHSQSGPC